MSPQMFGEMVANCHKVDRGCLAAPGPSSGQSGPASLGNPVVLANILSNSPSMQHHMSLWNVQSSLSVLYSQIYLLRVKKRKKEILGLSKHVIDFELI